ncbi:MAG: homocysteine S-methyltransferase family protein [Chloroflexota bacterium]
MLTATLTKTFLKRQPLLLDGGMGQELLHRGMNRAHNLWSANALVTMPEVVQEIHEDYIRAGADIITTNTYATVRQRLEPAGMGAEFAALNEQAGVLAQQALESTRATRTKEVWVAGSLPPLAPSFRPDLVDDFEALVPEYEEQAKILAPYVDLFICETMSTSIEAKAAAVGALTTGKPVWVSWTLADDLRVDGPPCLRSQETLQEAIAAIADYPIYGYLVNCSTPESITAAIPELVKIAAQMTQDKYTTTDGSAIDKPDPIVGAYANAFAPLPKDWQFTAKRDEHGIRSELSPNRYATFAQQWLADGVQVIGGCCETGPAHIAVLRELLDENSK